MPASLAMCRALRRSGATVIGTDSLDTTPLSGSNSVDLYVKTPSPSKAPDAFLAALSQLIKEHNVSHLIPMYEEGYVVAASLSRLAGTHPSTSILVDTVETLSILDDKWRFIAHCKSLGLPVPNTAVVTSASELRDQINSLSTGFVVKPVFSRFAQGVYIDPGPEDLVRIHPSVDSPWVVQERVIGSVASSYGICRNGKVLVHGDYGNDFVVGAKSKQGLGASSVISLLSSLEAVNSLRSCLAVLLILASMGSTILLMIVESLASSATLGQLVAFIYLSAIVHLAISCLVNPLTISLARPLLLTICSFCSA